MTWVWSNIGLILELSLTHIALSIPPIVIGFLLSVPIGWVAYRSRSARASLRWVSGLLLTISALLYTIPSLPLFVSLPAVIGTPITDPINVQIALTLYAIALMVGVAANGFSEVDRGILQSATAMGFSPWQRFWRVELPLAGPVLLSGVRVVAVSTVSLLTVGQLVGVTTLGYLFTNGLQRRIPEEVLAGIVAVVVIAVAFDLLLVLLGRLALPWTAPRKAGARRARAVTVEEVTS
ncbi:ABC transporter permease [Herbiconiux sp. L3-i23]|uniref:ABC transporter permease n=1 Tax=Herbiconiux sp. L3-i23 TaxID=2905871 RepID=UPI00204BC2EE|nr:ABC transporter permease subunit [Herbiconiux sp. L3-i23]BDI23102.1 ABC transporter permease [Herbiconiux sp. L3-i23]